jgi:hypothetical protein
MKARWPAAPLALLLLAPPLWADAAPAPKKDGPTYQVPYRLTDTLHVLVRVKLNGKGPFNFIVDTGAPLVYVTREAAKKLGLKRDKRGWATLDRLDVEGGPTQDQFKVRVETPFQLEGMNALGLAGAELHGILGYTMLSHYRIEFDFARDRLAWTRLPFQPPPPQPLGKKKGGEPPDLSPIAGLMKVLSFLVGKQPPPRLVPRGYLGVELAEADGVVTVRAVLGKSPAARAGLRAGDRLDLVQGGEVRSIADMRRHTARLTAGQPVRLTYRRGDREHEVTVTAGEGL